MLKLHTSPKLQDFHQYRTVTKNVLADRVHSLHFIVMQIAGSLQAILRSSDTMNNGNTSSLINTARCSSDSLDALRTANRSFIQARGIPFSEEMLFGTHTHNRHEEDFIF